MRSIFYTFVLIFSFPFISFGQSTALSGVERAILSVLGSDSVSPVVSYMPAGRYFGATGLPDKDQLVIIKTGRKLRFVSQETGFVFGMSKASGPLVRLDSNIVFGLEYHIDPFIRKDTMFMIATSKFLKGKGFLAYYDDRINDWKGYRGNDAVIKESTRPYYDPAGDQLYMVCNFIYEEPVDTARASNDNVMRYSFATGKWDAVGRLDSDVYSSAMNTPVQLNWLSSYGAGNLENGDLNVVQPDKNRWLSTDSVFRQRMFQDAPAVADEAKLLQVIKMGDTVFAFSGGPDSVQVDRIVVRESDFTVIGGKALYDTTQVPESNEEKGPVNRWIYALLGLAVVGLLYFWYKGRKAGNGKTDGAGGSVFKGNVVGQPAVTTPAAVAKQPVNYFLESLTPVEKSLVLELAHYANRGDMMDTQALNQILGVSQKEPEVQKVRRSLTITRINSNFSQMLAPEGSLIRREKDPADKRVFLYYITKEHAAILMAAGTI